MAGVVLILGAERLLAREAASRVLEANPGLEVTRLSGADAPAGRVLDELRTPTLLGGRRLVLVEDAEPLLTEAGPLEAIADYAERPVEGACLVLVSSRLDGRMKGAKRLRAAAEVVACDPPPPRDVGAWLAARARTAHGLEAGRPALDALRSRIGDDLGLLDAALARLAEQIAPRKRLEAEDVRDSTEEQRSPVLFEASNALEARDLPAALDAVAAAFRDGIRVNTATVTDPRGIAPILLGNLHKAYTKLLRFHFLCHTGDSPQEAAKRAGVSPRAQSFFLERARGHDLARLVERHEHFLRADLALKESRETPRRALEQLLIALLG